MRHRKLLATARDLRIKPVYLLGHLHALWHVVLEQQEDGDLSNWTDETIAAAAGFDGDAAKFVSLLTSHKWIDFASTSKRIHDWLDFAGQYLVTKYARRNRDRLAEIWQKYGRKYGEKGCHSDSNSDSQWTANGLSESLSLSVFNKDSSTPKDSSLPDASIFAKAAARLAVCWLMYHKGGHSNYDRQSADNFEGLLAAGVSEEAIEAEIKRPGREKTEPIWEFCKRLQPKVNDGKRAKPDDGRTSQRFQGTATPL